MRVINYRKMIIAAMAVLVLSYSSSYAQYGGGGGTGAFTIISSSHNEMSGQNPSAIISGICAMEKIVINLRSDGGSFLLSVLEITKPTGIPSVSGEEICYYRITVPSHISTLINNVEFHLKVPKTLLSGIDEDSLKLYRYDEASGAWIALPTDKTGEDASFVYYIANSTTLSFFALSGEEMEEAPPEIFRRTFTIEGFDVEVTLTNGRVDDLDINIDEKSLDMILSNVEEDAILTIDIPRGLLDSKNPDGSDTEFSLIIDGMLMDYEEESNANRRILTIEIPAFSEEVSIIGTFVVPEFGVIAMMVLAAGIASIVLMRKRAFTI